VIHIEHRSLLEVEEEREEVIVEVVEE